MDLILKTFTEELQYSMNVWKKISDCVQMYMYVRADVNSVIHYENTPIQMYRKFHLQKLKISW